MVLVTGTMSSTYFPCFIKKHVLQASCTVAFDRRRLRMAQSLLLVWLLGLGLASLRH